MTGGGEKCDEEQHSHHIDRGRREEGQSVSGARTHSLLRRRHAFVVVVVVVVVVLVVTV